MRGRVGSGAQQSAIRRCGASLSRDLLGVKLTQPLLPGCFCFRVEATLLLFAQKRSPLLARAT